MDSTTIFLAGLTLFLGLALGVLLGQRMAARSGADLREDLRALSAQAVTESSQQVFAMTDARMHAAERVVEPVRESLDRLSQRLVSLETQGASWQSQLKQQVESVHLSGAELRRETQALAEALRRPQVRGHWGEMQLRRSLELAGLLARCSFDEQVSRRTDDGLQRPDVVVSITGGKSIVIDSKVSLDAFLSATHATNSSLRDESLARHARQVRQHVDALAAKAYWQQFAPAPEFVVMFLPAEAIFSQALDTDPGLLDYAAGKQVMIATPITLIAMLKTVAYAWTQEALADNAREVHQLGRELYERLGTVGKHLDGLGRSLTGAVGAYNKTVGSMESRVLVTARRMRDLEVTDKDLPSLDGVVATPTPLTAPELVADEEAPLVIEGQPGREQWRRRAVGD
ncbi:MAG: DNA recombination protein RmuC [Actinomycetota bacterium]|nr:DNA recombination protein RmuC [Actinomycetota bacterium]